MLQNSILTFILLSLLGMGYSQNSETALTSQLANIILHSTTDRDMDPEHNKLCFAVYMPQITAATNKYQKCLDTSLRIAKDATTALQKDVQGDLDTIDDFANGMCGSFHNCTTITTSLYDTFECYYDAASDTIESAISVQKISKEKMRYVKNRLENINYDLETRNDECNNTYTEETLILYAKLEACLAGAPVEAPVETTKAPKPPKPTDRPPLPPTVNVP